MRAAFARTHVLLPIESGLDALYIRAVRLLPRSVQSSASLEQVDQTTTEQAGSKEAKAGDSLRDGKEQKKPVTDGK